MKRRQFLQAGIAGASAAQFGCSSQESLAVGPPGQSSVAILKAPSYSADLAALLRRGAQLCGLEAKGKRVLLKPNLVEFASNAAINTHVAVIAAAERLQTHRILTVDERHFRAVRPSDGTAFTLLPADA